MKDMKLFTDADYEFMKENVMNPNALMLQRSGAAGFITECNHGFGKAITVKDGVLVKANCSLCKKEVEL